MSSNSCCATLEDGEGFMEPVERKTCSECKGQKFVRGKPCRTCAGRGYVIPFLPAQEESSAPAQEKPSRPPVPPAPPEKKPAAAAPKAVARRPAGGKKTSGKTVDTRKKGR